jgi:hypothetical protein
LREQWADAAHRASTEAEAPEHMIEDDTLELKYWAEWSSTRRREHSQQKTRMRQELAAARRKAMRMGIVILVAGVGVTAGGMAYHLRSGRSAVAMNVKPISRSEYVRRLDPTAWPR